MVFARATSSRSRVPSPESVGAQRGLILKHAVLRMPTLKSAAQVRSTRNDDRSRSRDDHGGQYPSTTTWPMTGMEMNKPPKNKPQKPPQKAPISPEFDRSPCCKSRRLFLTMIYLADQAEIFIANRAESFFHRGLSAFVVREHRTTVSILSIGFSFK